MSESRPVNPDENPHLRGRFAPVREEVASEELAVEGALPTDLTGVYLRNGPNPHFTPLGSYTYPLEGDAMVHGVWLEGGRARYRNRWVRTQGFKAEERAGRALFGGVMTPAFVDTDLLGPDPDPGWPFRLDPFINVVRHAGRYLALAEGDPPYAIDSRLDTVGRQEFGGALGGMCAHPRIDPISGEMVVFRYDLEEPFLTWAVVGADGRISRGPTVVPGVDRSFMVHDFVLTKNHVVLLIAPAVLDLQAMESGGDILGWQPELGTRIAVIPRTGEGPVRWIEEEAFFVWHFANGFDDGDEIILDMIRWSSPHFSDESAQERQAGYARATLHPDRGTVDFTYLDRLPGEFPRIDDRLTAHPHRYVTLSRKSGDVNLEVGEFNQLVRYDMQTGERVQHTLESAIGEVVFAPRDGGTEELDGYYITFDNSLDGRKSRLLIWDAAQFPDEPMARIQLPRRVPNGLHGNWFPG